MMEQWKDVVGYEGLYQVSSHGRVMSFVINDGTGCGRLMRLSPQNKGYLMVGLRKDGATKSFLVHRIVASAFLPNPNKLPLVNHVDGIKSNNQVNNLQWCTSQENTDHAFNYGLMDMVTVGKNQTHDRLLVIDRFVEEKAKQAGKSIQSIHKDIRALLGLDKYAYRTLRLSSVKSNPRLDRLIVLSDYFGCKLDALFNPAIKDTYKLNP